MDKNTPLPKGFLKHPVHLMAFGFGSGCVPRIPGTVGTVIGIPIYLLIVDFPWFIYLSITMILFVAGIWICGITSRHLNVHDHQGIVWDEIVGFLIAMMAVPPDWRFILIAFMLFRLFDICKPCPIKWIDQKVTGGIGIMLDDVLAGIYTVFILQIFIYFL